ncbi:MAG: cation:proton antiporter [Gammaproteobacteria bacterium]
MHGDFIVYSIFLIFTGAAILAAVALYARQSMLVAYIALGVLAGPYGFALVSAPATIEGIGHIGIIFLLYLLGLNMHPQKLLRMLHEATLVTVASSVLFWGAAFALAYALFDFSMAESAIIGAAAMFSSTIIGLKLLPATALHHRHVGEVIISVLLLQDVVAIALLVLIDAFAQREGGAMAWLLPVVALPGLAAFAFVLQRYVLVPVMARFDTIAEFVFLIAVGWCLGLAQLGRALGLSYEMGAFIAGVALAAHPIALHIAESLKPLRDFFLIMFFFSLGAAFALPRLGEVALPALALGLLMLALKPVVFARLLAHQKETQRLSREIGVRLGQMSEFSLLIAVLSLSAGLLSDRAFYLIQATTLVTFIGSSYWIMLRYPTPIAVSRALRRD